MHDVLIQAIMDILSIKKSIGVSVISEEQSYPRLITVDLPLGKLLVGFYKC